MNRTKANYALAVGASSVALVLFIWVRLGGFPHQILPLAHGLPLLICLWHRRRSILWTMASILVATTFLKHYLLIPPTFFATPFIGFMDLWMTILSILIVTTVVHLVIVMTDKNHDKNYELEQLNESLEKANFELSQRDEELTRQNEELSAQGEELEQQREELQQQNEEQEEQAEELRQVNQELADREQALQILMGATRWSSHATQEREVLSQICEAAIRVIHGASSAAIAKREGDQLVMCGSAGHREKFSYAVIPYAKSFASLVIERGATAYVQDLNLRPDLLVLIPEGEPPVRSILASPLKVAGEVIGALEIFSRVPRDWTHEEFRIIEWLAAQSALVIEALQLQQELDQRRRAAEEESIRKTRFLAAVSHDVRTPANAISLLAELVARSATDDAARGEIPQLARDLQSNSKALVELVSDVLDVARFDSGQSQLQNAPFDLNSVISTEIRQLMPLAINKGLHLTSEAPSRPLWINSDRIKVARVISNLIANAIKFTEHGSVRVLCRLDESTVRLEVTDTGIGIPPEHQARIFDEFFQLRNPERDRAKGSGLGLAICNRLATAMGGSLGVSSHPGKGSTFTFTLPRKLMIDPPIAAGVITRTSGGKLADLRVLLVEDHDMTRRAAAALLASEGAHVLTAENGRAALHSLAHDDPHILLLDLMLPDLDGTDILRHLNDNRPASLQRILVISGDVTAARHQQVKELGANGLIPKPVDVRRLIELLQQHAADECQPVAEA